MKYGVYKFGSFNKVNCDCGWEGVRAELKKELVILEKTKDGSIFDVEDIYVCPICQTRKY